MVYCAATQMTNIALKNANHLIVPGKEPQLNQVHAEVNLRW